jgi:hypothetical protein
VNDVVLVEGGEALDDGSKGIEDFFFIEIEDVEASFSIFYLGFEGGLFLGVEEAVVILDRLEEGRVRDLAFCADIGVALKILVGLFGGFVE